MRALLYLTVVVLCSALTKGQADEGSVPVSGSAEQLAKGFVHLLGQKDFLKATAAFDANMKAAASPAQLEAIWLSQLETLGAYQAIQGTRTELLQQYQVVFVTCKFDKQQMDVKVVIDKANKVAGLFFVPTQVAYQPPDYARANLFREREVTFGTDQWTLPGTISLPAGNGPFPALVLVHGSGPQDRDETIGPNKPFRDLAWGLASHGVAVLRYEKRTRQHGAKFAAMTDGFTVKEETIADALEAVALLRKTEGIDASRVFVLGHSLGGMLVPRIGTGNSDVAGFVVMASNARPLEDLILEQTLYQASLRGELSADDKRRLEEVERQVSAIKALSETSLSKGQLLGAPTSYWLDLKGYSPAIAAKALQQPILLLQGEQDCQVSPRLDFGEWQQALSGRANVTSKSYPTLNHLFMKVDGKSTGAEYQQAGNVAEVVVDDIATWIGRH